MSTNVPELILYNYQLIPRWERMPHHLCLLPNASIKKNITDKY